ncbi:MAG TPA: hypothetical protein VJV03_19550 [Pyrinomonadaceae bacterium]|nr:hypothetical protein [Pyrinomonadaceae bacterium]
MRSIRKQLSWWPIVLLVGGTAFAMPIATRVGPPATVVVQEDHQTTLHHEEDSRASVGPGVAAPQNDYYDRRREYWEKRVERRLEEADREDQTGDDTDDEDANDDNAGKDNDSQDNDEDEVEQEIERRREYWRRRVDGGW